MDTEVVLVCDPVPDDADVDHLSADGDRPAQQSLELIFEGLSQAARRVVHYPSIQKFIDNIGQHRDTVVFPYWFGELSRNRHSLLPAVCEAYQLPYVGGDAYTKITCNDKHLSKLICAQADLATPLGVLLHSEADLVLLDTICYPAVVKPNSQGSSLGIDDDCLVQDSVQALQIARRIAKHIGWPIICEEFAAGREVSICLLGNHREPPEIRALSWAVNGIEDFLDHRVFSYSVKYLQNARFSPVWRDDLLTADLRAKCGRLFEMLNKVEVMRIDGRLTEDGFVVIELSPDLDMRPDGEMARAFMDRFGSYPAFLAHLLSNALERVGSQAPVNDEDEVVP